GSSRITGEGAAEDSRRAGVPVKALIEEDLSFGCCNGGVVARHRRTGTAWRRYKPCLVGHGNYVLRCHRYTDPNPVRARMTDDATQFPWPSAAVRCATHHDSLLTPHPAYIELGHDDGSRGTACRARRHETLSDDDLRSLSHRVVPTPLFATRRGLIIP
ncbi:MAG: hypothetical protein OQK79_12670, partial [Rhodanobacter sp.]|nr:hypothetical protein [Rhodanobacter sp.]